MSVRTRHVLIMLGLVLLGFLGYFLVPAGVIRAVLTAPVLLWVPGRSIVAVLGRVGRWTAPLSVVLSLITVVVFGLAVNLVLHSVPLGLLPVVVSAALLPLNMLGESVPRLPAVTCLLAGLAVALSGCLLLTVNSWLPVQPEPGYLEFSLSGPYAASSGALRVVSGEMLHVPVQASGVKVDLNGLTVRADFNGSPVTSVPLDNTGHASVEVTLGSVDCFDQLRFTLLRGTAELRAVTVNLTNSGGNCAHN